MMDDQIDPDDFVFENKVQDFGFKDKNEVIDDLLWVIYTGTLLFPLYT